MSGTMSGATGREAAMSGPIRCSVAAVIVTYNRRQALCRALAAVAGQSVTPERVCVVDNASTDGTPELLSQDFPWAHHLRMDANLGFAAGLAAGMEHYCDRAIDYLWLLDDDSRPVPTALERVLTVAIAVPRCGVVGLDGGTTRLGSPTHWHLGSDRGPSLDGHPSAYRGDFALLDGAVVPAPVVHDIGYPRGDFFMMMEDVEYTGRMRRRGWEVVVIDEDLIARDHLGSGDGPGRPPPPWRGYYQTRNHLMMALEHRSPPEVLGWLLRQTKLVCGNAMASNRRSQRVGLRLLGAWHGLRGVRGRTVEPAP